MKELKYEQKVNILFTEIIKNSKKNNHKILLLSSRLKITTGTAAIPIYNCILYIGLCYNQCLFHYTVPVP